MDRTHAGDVGLERIEKVPVHQHQLPHARPNSQLFLGLRRALVGHAFIQLLKDIVLEGLECFACNVPHFCLNRQWKGDQFVAWVEA